MNGAAHEGNQEAARKRLHAEEEEGPQKDHPGEDGRGQTFPVRRHTDLPNWPA